MFADKNRPSTWRKYFDGMCDTCQATCCQMPCEVTLEDLVRLELIDEFEAEEPPKKIAKKLKKMRVIEHFNIRNTIFTLQRLSTGECLYLDPSTKRCTVYEKRPKTCSDHPEISSRANYCPYNKKP